ncbi:hypothetical protein PVAND_002396 [Polypedilum vanderplanki]|uniref:F-box domain-containing protein n=1 Tax=Polypedilum vanderplanki TaxID=319348 RepID=A0A9J6BSD1_POLVA|nr:hypothetical protein PVAND_002396 [Polypedilum vanderplanki]
MKTDEQINNSRSMTCIDDIPDEILAEIFTFLSGKDLKSATLTNRTFANIVSSSSKLMKKFFLVITTKRKWDFETISSLQRKHQSLFFFDFITAENSLDKVLENGLENIGVNLKSIEFNDCCLYAQEFVKILNYSKNLTHLKILFSKINESSHEDLILPFLSNLKIRMSDINFELFHKIESLKKIQLEVNETTNTDVSTFQQILNKNSKLKTLTLVNLRLSNLFDIKMKQNFQLEILNIIQCHFKHKENFEIFLDSQKLLKEVELSFSHMKLGNDRVRYFESIVESIMKKKTLKNLTLNIEEYNFCSFNFLEVNRIENFTLRLKDTNFSSAQYLKYFPTLKSLELEVKELTNENMEILNNSLVNHLEIYNLTSECFSKLKIKSLKSLHLHETSLNEKDWMTFIENNPQIIKLVINFSLIMDFDVKLLDKITKKLNLEHIELTDKYIGFENEIYIMIVENCSKLKYIKLWNINIEKNFEEKDKEFLKKRNIKFHLFNDESLNKPMVPF